MLGQLGNRVQHALRAFTPRDQKAVKAAAETMRANPKIDTEKAITELAVGEALVSFLDEKGRPCRRARLRPAAGEPDRSGDGGRTAARDRRVGFGRCIRQARRSRIRLRASQRPRRRGAAAAARRAGALGGSWTDSLKDSLGGLVSGSGRKDSIVEAVAKSAARTVGSTIGREIVRGVLGSLLGGRKR